jgi:hypothetical protein
MPPVGEVNAGSAIVRFDQLTMSVRRLNDGRGRIVGNTEISKNFVISR